MNGFFDGPFGKTSLTKRIIKKKIILQKDDPVSNESLYFKVLFYQFNIHDGLLHFYIYFYVFCKFIKKYYYSAFPKP